MASTVAVGFEPVTDLNTTPLIDVMLVLLVMFIVTIPIQTHAIKLDLPAGTAVPDIRLSNVLGVDADGTMRWNGQPIEAARLRATLRSTQRMAPLPELHLLPDAQARFEDVDRILAMIKQERVTRVGFVGNEKYQSL